MQQNNSKDNNNNNNNNSNNSPNNSNLTGPSLVTASLAGNPREGRVGSAEGGHLEAENPLLLGASWIQPTRPPRT